MKTGFGIFQILVLVGISLQFIGCGSDDPIVPNDSISDIDGNIYTSVEIGNQIWMVENLMVTKYRNGDPIKNEMQTEAWSNTTTGAYSDMLNDPDSSVVFGRLYNWYAINDARNIAPEGWRIPSQSDWAELILSLGGEETAGGKLKESGTNHWCDPNVGGTNESGFTALPGGVRTNDFFLPGCNWGLWWTATEFDQISAYNVIIFSNGPEINTVNNEKSFGMSVRCIKN